MGDATAAGVSRKVRTPKVRLLGHETLQMRYNKVVEGDYSLLKLPGFLFIGIFWKTVEVADTPFLLFARFHIPHLGFRMLFADGRTAASEYLYPDGFFPTDVTWFLHAATPAPGPLSDLIVIPLPCLGIILPSLPGSHARFTCSPLRCFRGV